MRVCSQRSSTLFPYTTLFRSGPAAQPVGILGTGRLDADAEESGLGIDLVGQGEDGSHNGGGELVPGMAGQVMFENRPGYLRDRKSTRLNSSHVRISYAVFCLK